MPQASLPSSPPAPLWEARAGWVRRAGVADIRVRTRDGATEESIDISLPAEILPHVLGTLCEGPQAVLRSPREIAIAGHRIVHGGRSFYEPALISADVCAEIHRLAEFAPEHHEFELQAIEAAQRFLDHNTPQLAVFDTAFHATLPQSAYVYPGPYSWIEQGVRRYGFHGISHRYTAGRAAELLGQDLDTLHLVTCHLGNGASLAAIREGRSVDTTMGFTPLEGLMMGTRSGTIDPGIVTYLARSNGNTVADIERLLNKQSGLKGLSGISADMREISSAIDRGDTRAKLAFDVFVHRLCREIGGMLASLDRLDALVFTGGVGENSAAVREQVCSRFAWLGIKLDREANLGGESDRLISEERSPVRALVVRTEEEWQIARECHRALGQARLAPDAPAAR